MMMEPEPLEPEPPRISSTAGPWTKPGDTVWLVVDGVVYWAVAFSGGRYPWRPLYEPADPALAARARAAAPVQGDLFPA